MHEGDTVQDVGKMTKVLATVKSPVDHKPYLPEAFPHFGPKVVEALKKFQKEHHQKPDGKMGSQTATQLAVANASTHKTPRITKQGPLPEQMSEAVQADDEGSAEDEPDLEDAQLPPTRPVLTQI